jgi:uncharacterized protein (DUF58 family)
VSEVVSGGERRVSEGWRPGPALVRAGLISTVLSAVAVTFGQPALLVLAAPFLLHTVVGLVRRPRRAPVRSSWLDHTSLREGEGTRLTTRLDGIAGAEHAVVALTRTPWTAYQPPSATRGTAVGPGRDVVEVPIALASRRWGRRSTGAGVVAATSEWAAYQWGPHRLDERMLTTLPMPGRFDSAAPVPHPIGLVGNHPARRTGDGSEFASIRPFTPGDRLRRVQWRVSLRTGDLHVTSTVAEEDSSVLLLLDSGTELGESGGIGGKASSLDVAVRAAGAIAEHYLHTGDRVGLRVLGATSGRAVPLGGGNRQLRRLLDTLARVEPGRYGKVDPSRMRLHVGAGTVVVVLSPMLSDQSVASTRMLAGRGLTVVVVDTLPPDLSFAEPRRQIAWRMRLLEREAMLRRVEHSGVPVVTWRGPGTLDEVLRGLGRRARAPRLVAR